MQPWQVKALKLEASALNHLDGFIHEHSLYFLIGAIYLLLALLVWVLRRRIATKGRKAHVPRSANDCHSIAGNATAATGPGIPAVAGTAGLLRLRQLSVGLTAVHGSLYSPPC